MNSDRHSPDDLEDLSALFDGELDGDAARFARKRLGHDSQWQQACGRWQLIGDALRGQATAAAPADFAARVSALVSLEPVPVAVPEPAAAPRAAVRGNRRVWVGSALAASLALVAVFVARPPTAGPDAQAPVATAGAIATPQGPDAMTPVAAPPVTQVPVAVAAAPGAESTVPAISEPAGTPTRPARLPRSPRVEQAARASTARIAREVQQRAEGLGDVVRSDTARISAVEAAPDPFRPRGEIATRPWPRAVLPNSQAAGALTASFEAQAPGSRSFYPFEPQAPADPDAAPVRQP